MQGARYGDKVYNFMVCFVEVDVMNVKASVKIFNTNALTIEFSIVHSGFRFERLKNKKTRRQWEATGSKNDKRLLIASPYSNIVVLPINDDNVVL